jgi:hypothetical protein
VTVGTVSRFSHRGKRFREIARLRLAAGGACRTPRSPEAYRRSAATRTKRDPMRRGFASLCGTIGSMSTSMPRVSKSIAAERRFFLAMTAALVAAVLLGFSRTFFLRHWFPDWSAAHAPTEPYFYVHGALFGLWFLLLVVQAFLVIARRIALHRRLG